MRIFLLRILFYRGSLIKKYKVFSAGVFSGVFSEYFRKKPYETNQATHNVDNVNVFVAEIPSTQTH